MKSTIISIIIAILLISGAMILSAGNSDKEDINIPKENVSEVSGIQYIDLTAKGGYSPKKSEAQAGIHTILRVTTSGTFDCSSFIRIPSMNVSKNLSQTGTTEIDLGTTTPGVLYGTCGMGMYPFEINFK